MRTSHGLCVPGRQYLKCWNQVPCRQGIFLLTSTPILTKSSLFRFVDSPALYSSKVICASFFYLIGQYANSTLQMCIPCSSGKFSSSSGSLLCTGVVSVKKAGYYWATGSTSNAGVICPPGYYCLNGTGVATPCPAGRYNASFGAANVTSCNTCTATLSGYVCGQGGTRPNGTLCPPGTYANVSLQACIQ